MYNLSKEQRSMAIQILSNYTVATSEIDIRDDSNLYISAYKYYSKYSNNELIEFLREKNLNYINHIS